MLVSTEAEMSHSETRKGFISVRPALGRQWTSVPKIISLVLKIAINVGQKFVAQCS